MNLTMTDEDIQPIGLDADVTRQRTASIKPLVIDANQEEEFEVELVNEDKESNEEVVSVSTEVTSENQQANEERLTAFSGATCCYYL